MGIDRVLSVNVFVGSLDVARRFYVDALALQVGRSTDQVISLCPTGTPLNLLRALGDDTQFVGRPTGITLRMRGEGDLGRVMGRLRQRGVALLDEDFGPWRGGHRCHVADPFGNRLTLLEEHDPRDEPHMFDGAASVTVRVRDIYRALDFYVAMLEVPMLEQPDPHTAVLLPGGTTLVLAQRPSWSAAEPVAEETGVVLEVDDPNYTFGLLESKGIRLAERPRTAGEVVLASVVDPDGNRITLMGKSAQ